MTMRERMLAYIQGRDHDRVPFVVYEGLGCVGFRDREEGRRILGADNIGFLRWTAAHRLESPNCRWEHQPFTRPESGLNGYRLTLHTPAGSLWEERLLDPVLGSAAAETHFIKEPEDYRPLMAYLRDTRALPAPETFMTAYDELLDDGLPHTAVLRSPFQQLWVQWVSIEDLCLHMVDCPELLDEVFAELERLQDEVFRAAVTVCRQCPVPYLNVPDNITAPMLGPALFTRYCAPAYNRLAELLDDAGIDIPVQVHMDGDLRPLWPHIAATRVRALDSMSPPPDNDTSVADALREWPGMRIGINFPSSVHLQPGDRVYAAAMEILTQNRGSGRLQIQISENVPPGRWQESFPAIIRAIRDYHTASQPG